MWQSNLAIFILHLLICNQFVSWPILIEYWSKSTYVKSICYKKSIWVIAKKYLSIGKKYLSICKKYLSICICIWIKVFVFVFVFEWSQEQSIFICIWINIDRSICICICIWEKVFEPIPGWSIKQKFQKKKSWQCMKLRQLIR